MRSERPRKCTECGGLQRLVHKTTDYRESGLDNLQLVDAPIWECGNGHEEIEIPNADELHQLLTSLLIRKPALLRGTEVRFLRKELGLSGRAFAERLGLTPEHLSRLETGGRIITSTIDLLVRLSVGWELTRRERIEFPRDVTPTVAQLEAASDAEPHRVRHCGDAPRDRRWASVSV